jgi:hypothetical protein
MADTLGWNYTIVGLEELADKVHNPALLGDALRAFWRDAVMTTQREVQTRTKRDTSRLAGSITSGIDSEPIPLFAWCGTNVEYGQYVEYDTRPHWVPKGVLAAWAHRHNISEEAVRRAIARHGTKGAHMFDDGLAAAVPQFPAFAQTFNDAIEGKWSE